MHANITGVQLTVTQFHARVCTCLYRLDAQQVHVVMLLAFLSAWSCCCNADFPSEQCSDQLCLVACLSEFIVVIHCNQFKTVIQCLSSPQYQSPLLPLLLVKVP